MRFAIFMSSIIIVGAINIDYGRNHISGFILIAVILCCWDILDYFIKK